MGEGGSSGGEVGAALRALRTSRGLRQKELASRVGVSPSYLALIESGRRVPGEALRGRLAAALGLPPDRLSQEGRVRTVGELRSIPGGRAAAAAEPAAAFAAAFPEWAGLLATLAARLRRAERRITELSDPLRHDDRLSERLHEVLSAAASVSTTASILEDEAVHPNWRRRFVRNIGEDAKRLASATAALSDWLEAKPERGDGEDDSAAWLARMGGPDAVLRRDWRELLAVDPPSRPEDRSLVERTLARLEMDAEVAPDLPADCDPVAFAAGRGLDPALALRRAAVLRGAGLVVSDGAGPPAVVRTVPGFPIPGRGQACPLWPLHHAVPGRPHRAVCVAQDETGARFLCTAASTERSVEGVPVIEKVMLIEPAGATGSGRPVGPGCASCPAPGCPARRGGEPVQIG